MLVLGPDHHNYLWLVAELEEEAVLIVFKVSVELLEAGESVGIGGANEQFAAGRVDTRGLKKPNVFSKFSNFFLCVSPSACFFNATFPHISECSLLTRTDFTFKGCVAIASLNPQFKFIVIEPFHHQNMFASSS